LIEVFVDTEQGFLPKLASRKNEDGSMTSPELEDMAPFLSRDELKKNMLI
jgi:acetolactate synthase-1/2/3 large subunit